MKTIKVGLVVSMVLSNVTLAYAETSMAILSSTTGKVLVNKGQGFVPADGMVSLRVGDTVMVGEGSFASVSYKTGCTVDVKASSIVVVTKKAPCSTSQALTTSDSAFVVPAADLDPNMGAAAAPVLPLSLLLLGGTAVTAVSVLVLSGPFKNNGCGISGCAN